ncbi:hypothetical protein AX769_08835 [Frondihabitans sp. PAMC 28766]|nr:hypothetical protein AX769_08835 [Frondihabitans sp. PAMC 28766]
MAGATATLVALGIVLPALPASAASVAMTIAVAADGHGPFTDSDEPGGDANDHNGVVRTNDSVVYEVTVNSTGGTATNETFTLTARTTRRGRGSPPTVERMAPASRGPSSRADWASSLTRPGRSPSFSRSPTRPRTGSR